jgi:hypothetical protein
LRRLWGSGLATSAKHFWDGGKINVWFGVLTYQASRTIQCTQASGYMVRIRSPEGDRSCCILCKPFWITSHFDDDRVVASSPSSWHGTQFRVLRVEMFCFSSSKISIYESPFLPEPTARAVCREGGPETEFATAGT